MKTFLKFLFHTFYTFFFFVCGCFLLSLYFDYPVPTEIIQEDITTFLLDKTQILAAGSILILIPLLYLLTHFLVRRKETFLSYNTPEGEILISVFAVEEVIKKITRNFREIKDAYPTIVLKGKDSIEVHLKLKIWSGVQNLPVAIEEIQKEIRRQIQEMVGIENIHGVHVFLAKDSFVHRDTPVKQRRSFSEFEIKNPSIEPEKREEPIARSSDDTLEDDNR